MGTNDITDDQLREAAEAMALSLPPEDRHAAVERLMTEGRAMLERNVAIRLAGDRLATESATEVFRQMHAATAWRPKVRVEVPANLRPQETNVYLDGIKLGEVVAVRLQRRRNGQLETYLVLRTKDADVQMAEGFADLEFGRLDLSVRQVAKFDVGVSMDSRQPYDGEDLLARATEFSRRNGDR